MVLSHTASTLAGDKEEVTVNELRIASSGPPPGRVVPALQKEDGSS
jgi:hypothetical protein